MPRDLSREPRLEDLSDEEIERIEAEVFCMGGPTTALNAHLIWRAGQSKAPPLKGARRYI